MLIAFHTQGCKVNQYETQAMRRQMEQAGYETTEFVPSETQADVLVINSCTVTGESDRKLRQFLRRCRRALPDAVIVLCGCMSQAYPEAAFDLPEVDIVLGNAKRNDLLPKLEEFFAEKQRICCVPPHTSAYEPMEIDAFQGRTRAFVKIQDGCNRFCSYCIIPYARGRVRSRQPQDITNELTRLAANGYKEVVLVGINLTAYGQDLGLTIADAVDAACAVDGLERIRLGSLEPDFITDEVIARMKAQPKLCPQFHLALQSGCDATLKRMNRHYTTAEYADLCSRLRHHFPDCAITTDIMVGFPGKPKRNLSKPVDLWNPLLLRGYISLPILAVAVPMQIVCPIKSITQPRTGAVKSCKKSAIATPAHMRLNTSVKPFRYCWKRRIPTVTLTAIPTPIST